MTDDLRTRIRSAISAQATARGLEGPGRVETATVPLDAATDAVMAALDREFPPLFALDPPPELSPEQVAAWQAQWAEAISGDTRQHLIVLPPNASDLWRRHTPTERRAYLETHRDEAIERGIPEDLVDMMIRDAENADD